MSSSRRPPGGQLDMPLVWELEPIPEEPSGGDDPFVPPGPSSRPPSAGRLVLAAAADLGALLLCVAGTCLLAATLGAGFDPLRLALTVAVGIEAASVAAMGCLWAWRASPGMMLLRVTFASPLAAGRVVRVWLGWLSCLPLGGVPLVAGPAGGRGLERLAGQRFSPQSSRGAA